MSGLTVKLCQASDTTCANPDATGTTDSTGQVVLADVPLNNTPYVGYADVTGSNIPETLVYLPPFGSDPALTLTIVNSAELGLSGAALYGNPDTTDHGVIIGNVSDCAGHAASGVVISVDPTDTASGSATTVFYVSSAVPQNSTSTVASGQYVVTNVPPGDAETLTATNSNGDVTGIYTVVIKAGAVTTVIGFPNH